jgi:hypothetical protein
MGQACATSSQCTSSYCKLSEDPATGATSDCGVCATAPVAGEACTSSNYCDYGLRCVETPIIPGGLVCIRPAVEGGHCDEVSDSPCEGSLVCVLGSCAKPLGAGGACTQTSQCGGDLRCVTGACGPALSEGAACASDDRVCGDGLGCRMGVCTKLLPDGAPCAGDDECVGFCDVISTGERKCVNRSTAKIGDACAPLSSPDEGPSCVYQAFCDPMTRQCGLRKPYGQSCRDDSECLGWLRCNAGKCDEPAVPMCGS